jgi:hypothetical protein
LIGSGALEVSAFDRTGLGEAVERPDASREVVEGDLDLLDG